MKNIVLNHNQKVWWKKFKSFFRISFQDILKMSQIKNLKKVLKKNEQTFLSVSGRFFHYNFYTNNALKCLKKVCSKKVKKTLKNTKNGRKTGENGRKRAKKRLQKKAQKGRWEIFIFNDFAAHRGRYLTIKRKVIFAQKIVLTINTKMIRNGNWPI